MALSLPDAEISDKTVEIFFNQISLEDEALNEFIARAARAREEAVELYTFVADNFFKKK